MNEGTLEGFMGGRDWHWFRYPYLNEGDTLEKRHEVRKYLRERGYKVAQVTIDFQDWAWDDPYARCMDKHDSQAVEWLKSSYLSMAAEYVSLGQKMAVMLFGRDIRHVLLLHIGAFDSVMLPSLLDSLAEAGIRIRIAAGSGARSRVPNRPGRGVEHWRNAARANGREQTPRLSAARRRAAR